ncbi:MAG: undecaprenyl-phosphate glucose phosphotransferase [Hyphomicrobiaceae bacterium]
MSKSNSATIETLEIDNTGSGALSAISQHVPRLADFRRADRSSLIPQDVVRTLVRISDFAISTILGMLIALTYVGPDVTFSSPFYTLAIALTGITTLVAFEILKLYQVFNFTNIFSQMSRIVLGWTIAFSLLLVSMFFLKAGHDFSRVWLAAWYISGATTLLAYRLMLAGVSGRWKKQGRLYRRAVVYGAGAVMDDVLAELEADTSGDIRISGIFDERRDERAPAMLSGYPHLGGLAELICFARNTRIDLVILALPINAETRIAQTIKALSVLPVDIKVPARATKLRFSPRTYSRLGKVAMIDMHDKPITGWNTIVKWAFDKIVALVALILLAPVMATVAIAIKLDSRGPVFFRQKRYGFNNELIEIYKFRSMRTDMCDATASKLVTKNDPRVTRIGAFIRKTSIDELPQLINVLKGNLSLVGPRPHALQAKAGDRLYDDVVEGYFARHKVNPGITGWAQINGWRGETDTKEKIEKRVEHDLYYIENWSIFLDLYILVKTPFALLQTENAY